VCVCVCVCVCVRVCISLYSCVQGFISLSSPFQIAKLQEHFRTRGMSRELLHGIFAPVPEPHSNARSAVYSYHDTSPIDVLGSMSAAGDLKHSALPPCLLLHGEKDATVPVEECLAMYKRLQTLDIPSKCKIYDHDTHTSLFVEGPMAGGRDQVLQDVIGFVQDGCNRIPENEASPASVYSWPLIPFPRVLKYLASAVCPF
jgi:prenylcysteine alpha-carboxyl methylesterase